MIGNSSSGIIEAPFFKIPTINIGDRQKGRYKHASVINCSYSKNSIQKAINLAKKIKFKKKILKSKFFFGNGKSSEKILKQILKVQINENILRKK